MVEDVGNKFKISVWWDIENCMVPNDVDPHYIAQNMAAALQHANLTGPIEIQVFGDTHILSRTTQKALSDTGITLNHVPRGNKDAADKAILVAMLLWALDNPPPANILLISGDGDFASALHRLRLKTYSILLAIPAQFVKLALTGAAKRLWFWKDMAKGQLAEPEIPQAGSNTPLEVAGSSTMETFSNRKNKKPLISSAASSSSAVSNGYVSPQKTKNNIEHFRSMSLDDRSRHCDSKVFPGQVHSTCTSKHVPAKGATLVGLLPKEPLQRIDPNNKRGVNNVPIAQSATPDDKINHNKITLNNVPPNYPHPKGVTMHLPTTSSLPSTVVVRNEGKLPHDTCLNKIYCAMKTLERDMLAPTESNLYDCIQYWDRHFGTIDLKQTLKIAADLRQVTKTQLGGGLIMYFPPNHTVPWNCVDPGNMSANHSTDVWLELQEFLLHNERKQVFLSSSSRYSAGLILKSSCGMHIQNLAVGNILSLLQQAIQVKRWLWKTGPGWSPLTMNQKALLDWHGSETSKTNQRTSSNPIGMVDGWKPAFTGENAIEKDALFMKLRSFLSQTLKDGPGYNLSCLAKDFELATGTSLDHQKLGFANLCELVKSLSDLIHLETTDSGFLLLHLVRERNSGLMGLSRADKENALNALS